MKNRKLLLIVSLVLALTMSLGGTLAYLTDTDADVNVMTLGNVKIVQNEQQRVQGETEFTNVLEEFEQGKMLLPVTYPGNRTADTVTIGDYEIVLSDDEANYVDKIISVTNTGNSDAYIRTLVAVPTGGEDWEPTPVTADNCWLHWNLPTGYDAHWTLKSSNVPLIEVDGKGYYVWEFVHTEAVEKDETTFPMVRGFYMDERVDADDTSYYIDMTKNGKYDEDTDDKRVDDFAFGETVDILVLSQAVQASGFADAQTALDTAFGTVSANAATWFGGLFNEDGTVNEDEVGSPGDKNDTNNPPFIPDVTVTTFEELSAAAAAGKTIKMANDIDGEAAVTAPYGNKLGLTQNGGIIDGGNNELAIECYGDDYGIMTSGGTIRNLTIEEGCRAVMIMYPTEDVILENVNIGGDGVLYPINTGETATGVSGLKLIVKDSVIKGWTSFEIFESASFTNVEFGQGTYYNNIYGRVLKPYVNTTIKDCSFIEHYNLDLSELGADCKVVIENCTVAGQKLTADICTIPQTNADYDNCTFTVDLPEGRDLADCVTFK